MMHKYLFPGWISSKFQLCCGYSSSMYTYPYLCGFLVPEESKVKVKCSRYRPGVDQRVGRGIALLFHDCGTRRGWVVSSMSRAHFTPGKDPVPILQETGWASGPVWTGGKSRPHRDLIPGRPAHRQLLYWLSYPVHFLKKVGYNNSSCTQNIHTTHKIWSQVMPP